VTEARTDISQLFKESVSPGEARKVLNANRELVKTPITLYSDPKANLEKLDEEISIWAEACTSDKKLILVDTIQFIAHTDPSHPSLHKIVNRLKRIAQTTNSILIFTTNVLPTAPENRTPVFEDFEGGGAVITEADFVLSLNTFRQSSSVTVLKRNCKASEYNVPLVFETRWQTWFPG
jgi:hypothetical protein